MVAKEKLYEAFGELIYAVAKADGIVQEEEIDALHKILSTHSWAADISWSFNYERSKNNSVESAYAKAIDIFKENGPHHEYEFFIEVMQLIADANGGTSRDEQNIMDKFKSDLLNSFKEDISIIGRV